MLIKLNCRVHKLANEGRSDASISIIRFLCFPVGKGFLFQQSWAEHCHLRSSWWCWAVTGRERWQVWQKFMTTGGNLLCSPCWCFHFSCRLQPHFFSFWAFSFSFSSPKIRPTPLQQHWLWRVGSNWGSGGTPKVACFLHLWLRRPSQESPGSIRQRSDLTHCTHRGWQTARATNYICPNNVKDSGFQ